MDNEEKVMQNAQYRKGLSIAFFNATNNATEVVKLKFQGQDLSQIDPQVLFDMISKVRDWLLFEHKKYYAEVIAKVGTNYNAEETIKRLQSATNMDELGKVWVSISEDERRDPAIKKVAGELKTHYEEAQ